MTSRNVKTYIWPEQNLEENSVVSHLYPLGSSGHYFCGQWSIMQYWLHLHYTASPTGVSVSFDIIYRILQDILHVCFLCVILRHFLTIFLSVSVKYECTENTCKFHQH